MNWIRPASLQCKQICCLSIWVTAGFLAPVRPFKIYEMIEKQVCSCSLKSQWQNVKAVTVPMSFSAGTYSSALVFAAWNSSGWVCSNKALCQVERTQSCITASDTTSVIILPIGCRPLWRNLRPMPLSHLTIQSQGKLGIRRKKLPVHTLWKRISLLRQSTTSCLFFSSLLTSVQPLFWNKHLS